MMALGVCKVGLVVSWMIALGVYKVGLVVSWMMAPGADVDVVGDPSNDSESTRALGEETTFLPRPLPLIPDPRPAPRPIFA